MNVVINHKYIPSQPGVKTKRGFPVMGGTRIVGSKWWNTQENIWPAVFEQGESMPLSEFQSRFNGILRAAGFSSNYAKETCTMGSLQSLLIDSGVISIVE